jgi:hypothetical protein
MKKILIILALLAALQLLSGEVNWELQYSASLEQLQMLRQYSWAILWSWMEVLRPVLLMG